MTPQQLIGTAVRLFAIWLGITSIAYLGSIPRALTATALGDSNVTVSYALGGLYITVAVLLWMFPMSVAHKIVPRTHHTDAISFRAHELARVGCALLGLWLVSKALPPLVWLLFRSFLHNEASGSSYASLTFETKIELAVACFQLAVAMLAIVKAKAFADVVAVDR